MATDAEYEAAAATDPSKRTSAQQDLMKTARDQGMTSVLNKEAEADKERRYNW